MNVPYSQDQFVKCATNNDIFAVELFLKAGMDINAKDSQRSGTALMATALKNRSQIVETFLKHKANIAAQDYYGNTALMYSSVIGSTKIVSIL